MRTQIQTDINQLVEEWIDSGLLNRGDIFVIGCSTSEVAGEHIGTHGSEEIAAIIYQALFHLKQETGVQLAFQGCEHINRALVIETETFHQLPYLEEVTVVPHPKAGGSMASYAYKQMRNPVVVEKIQAQAGIDVGDTMIGMHIKHVAIPLRMKQKSIGNAHVTAASSRPKLIGGERAHYPEK